MTSRRARDHVLADAEAALLALTWPVLLCETALPAGVTTHHPSIVSLCDAHAKCGKHSLRWDHTPGGWLRFDGELGVTLSDFVPGDDQSLMGVVPMFSFWVYNETPVDDTLRLAFGRDDREDCHVTFHLGFSGWRTCWVRYGYDTVGTPQPDMNRVTITAPQRPGTLWFDVVARNVAMRPDNATPDFQVPQVQPTIASNDNYHWLGLRDYWKQLTDPGFGAAEADPDQFADVEKVRSRLIARQRHERPLTRPDLDALEARLERLDVPPLADPLATATAVRPARPGSFIDGFQSAVLPREVAAALTSAGAIVPLEQVCQLALEVAQTWDTAAATGDAQACAVAEVLYLRLTAHLLDQGWAAGSAQGTIHHIGYQYSGWASSLLLAEPLLRERGLWETVRDAIAWFCGAGRLTNDFSELKDLCGVVDVLNTLAEGMLVSCLARDSRTEQVAGLAALGRWLNNAHRHTPGILDGYKPDGFCFHHIGPYLAYGRDALAGSIPVIGDLAGTAWALDAQAARTLRQAMLTMATVAHTHEWPVALCGRHPRGTESIHCLVTGYGLLGRTPLAGYDTAAGIDVEMAATFRRLAQGSSSPQHQELDAYFASRGIGIAPEPEGYWQYGYAALGVHRSDGWMASVKGHNRYLWATEIYDGANAYGRYLTYGQIEIQSIRDEQGRVTHAANGWAQPGYDWNHIPGATTRVLPYEDLRADLTGTIQELLLTESSFGGAGRLTNRAVLFGMQLAEHPRHDPTHRANISVLMVGERIIALGSNIRNDDRDHPTHTTMFQVAPDTMADPAPVAAGRNWATDPAHNGYVVSHGDFVVRVAPQSAPHQNGIDDAAIRTMALAWIDHGTQPVDAGYDYVVLVGAGQQRTESFAAALEGDAAPYVVAQRDAVAHVVEDRESGVRAHVIFTPGRDLVAHSIVQWASRACLVLVHMDDATATVSVTDPDLHLYEGPDPDQYDELGQYRGQYSSYSRPWRSHPSPPTTITVVLRGLWASTPTASSSLLVTPEGGNATRVTLTTQHAASVEFTLHRQLP